MVGYLKNFEKMTTLSLIGMMVIVVALSIFELGWILYKDIMTPPLFLLEIDELFEIFGFFLMVLIGLELIETMKEYLVSGKIRLHVIFAVAIIAISRKVIILEPEKYESLTLIGIAVIMLALVIGYKIVKNAENPQKAEG
ncbi:MAG TPA: phosphate-starvation-inducible PsiE family protein [Candidatus Thiothrix moscowensis]|uniref:phosphate-starvation-inducible PsiE family protein n=1 Tax=unclassified Thiothrix TaxID=2636184 RepID=UPI0025E704B0|nr:MULTISPECIES: phosphate-starvation-inducible PsiE family protein [unclassified Thiothrix]HRJ54401.1 phosphate-starvation-inducible PsiE family protein [Candidatus Thiothrix moscowensis]HRJ94735.1 phosphate-starvation-inducible PsiE family protein [Candidatus Thiothrix moscowensis]